ncbi:hypothetical protein IQ241_16785 [Romeria aff. gracilis LEGE 07310]|uniref:Uncharacterized protein n=1 Tax=Vasconcelosia minhoensis LEGE 07310 TaxID=915328 RepID=A0A8J7AH98_9CYAN|nr:hypothetical protein [Romeria gracilis]MBE9078929.1 hypothetical protein [Romeria aff. gracilis LEGE 07310]
MPYLFYLAYGEGQFGATASGVFLGIAGLVIGCVAFVLLSYKAYPADQE